MYHDPDDGQGKATSNRRILGWLSRSAAREKAERSKQHIAYFRFL
jgi:hypothetical protein